MTQTFSPPEQGDLTNEGIQGRMVRLVRGIMEVIVLTLAVLAPWAFGAVDALSEFWLYVGVALLLLLWATRALVEGRLTWQRCPVVVCLAALFLFGAWQLVSLPRNVLGRIAPATARLYDRLLPERPEKLPFEEKRGDTVVAPGSTLSLYPYATRRQVVRLLAVFLLFAVVRNNTASAAALERLSVVALVNGTLLSLFGLVQFFTSTHLLYWTCAAERPFFGPFIDPNHFALYLNLCVGLGMGLLLSRSGPSASRPLLWIVLALVVMLGGIAYCPSRGGHLAICAGSLVCLMIQLARSNRSVVRRVSLLALTVALAAVAWFGWSGIATPLWSRTFPILQAFPLWGTGFGTFPLVFSPSQHLSGVNPPSENAYLEALVEGGAVRLVLSLLVIGLVFRLGYRAFRQHEDEPAGGLVLGALFAFTTLVVHSFFVPGLHVPAIAILATVLCAQVSAAAGTVSSGTETDSHSPFDLRLGGLAPLLGAVGALALGLVLCGEGWRVQKVQGFQVAASRLAVATDEVSHANRLAYLKAAVQGAPAEASLQLALAQAHAHLFGEQMERLRDSSELLEVAQTVLAWSGLASLAPATQPAWAAGSCWALGSAAREQLVQDEERLLQLRHQVPALRHCLLARDACPYWAEPNLLLAEQADNLAGEEESATYLERAKLIAAEDPGVWYRCGIQEMANGDTDDAWKSWRRSLELSDRYLPGILDRSSAQLDPEEISSAILPNRPSLLSAAALYLYPGSEAAAERQLFLEKTLAERRQ